MNVSVILCTHAPRPDHFARTLAGLQAQTLPTGDWELIVVENAASPALRLDAAYSRGNARIVLEPVPGLVSARIRGIDSAAGPLLVFVDDDNVLAPDYLATAWSLHVGEPTLGSFGGQVRGEFEVPPRPWFAARLDRLAIREFSAPVRSSRPDPSCAPRGAGLCLRAEVARRYAEAVRSDPRRAALGRRGRKLSSGDDLDLAFCATDLGLLTGCAPELNLVHLIPRDRLTLRYFACITAAHARGDLALRVIRPDILGGSAWHARWAWWKWSAIAALLSVLPAGGRS